MNDRLDKYFVGNVDDFVFLELMPEYVKREHLDFMRNVPLPVKKEYVGNLVGDNGIEFKHFTMGMIYIMGINPGFKFVPQYVNFLNYVNKDISRAVVSVGIGLAKNDELEDACITFRAALVIDPEDTDALYNYMLVCRNLYLASDDNEYIADFKSEVYDSLITLREIKPQFARTYYYLGYAYINTGRYADAQREWQKFMELSGPCEERREIEKRLRDIDDPVRIEQGYTDVINGRWEQGLEILEDYKFHSKMMEWWPLPYYLGVGYSRLGRHSEALEMLKKALEGNPSSAEIMAELVIVNNALGDEVNAEKYKKKIQILRERNDTED